MQKSYPLVKMTSSRKPIVAIVGASGYVGRFLTEAFLEAKDGGRIRELRLLTSKSPASDALKEFESLGASLCTVNFAKKETLLAALKSVDIVISAMGTGQGSVNNRFILLESLVQTGVDVYFPSEFGTNHYSSRMGDLDHSAFDEKKQHFKDASLKTGLKTVRLCCSMIMEYTFGSWCGLDCSGSTPQWRIPGQGSTPVAFTSRKDIGRFTVEAALLAWTSPDSVPSLIEVVGDSKTLKETAELFDSVSGKKTKFILGSYEDAKKKFEKTGNFLDIFPLLFESGALGVKKEEANGNQILGGSWGIKSFADYAKECGGTP